MKLWSQVEVVNSILCASWRTYSSSQFTRNDDLVWIELQKSTRTCSVVHPQTTNTLVVAWLQNRTLESRLLVPSNKTVSLCQQPWLITTWQLVLSIQTQNQTIASSTQGRNVRVIQRVETRYYCKMKCQAKRAYNIRALYLLLQLQPTLAE